MFVSAGDRTNVAGSDLSDILPEEIEAEVKLAAEISMGTEVSEEDIGNIRHLCDQVCVLTVCYSDCDGSDCCLLQTQGFLCVFAFCDWYPAFMNLFLNVFFIFFSPIGGRDFRIPGSALRLPEEQNDGNRSQPNCNGGGAGWCPSHLTCRWIGGGNVICENWPSSDDDDTKSLSWTWLMVLSHYLIWAGSESTSSQVLEERHSYSSLFHPLCDPGSLLNLAKHPASTVQILGAEKALFRALKTRKDTPKYGLIYHASLVGQTTAKNKGKVCS